MTGNTSPKLHETLQAAAKRLRLGVEGPRIADELDAIATALAPPSGEGVGELIADGQPAMGSGFLHSFASPEKLPAGTKVFTTPQSAPGDGDVEVDVAACKREPYPGVITSAPTTDAPVEAFTALRHALDNSVCYCGVDPTAIVTLRQDEARRMLDALTTPPPASQERGDGFRKAWYGVCAALDEVSPGWLAFNADVTAIDLACTAIRELAPPPSSAAEDVTAGGTSTSDDELPGMWSPSDLTGGATDAAEQAKPMSIQQMFDAEQAQTGELPEVMPCSFAVFDEYGDSADDRVWDYAREQVSAAIRSRLAGGVTVDDAMVERLAKYIYQQEARKCSTLDAYLHHMKGWPRALPEARAMLVAALGAKDGR